MECVGRFVVGKERATLRRPIKLTTGFHTFSFQFEGRLRGCNLGRVVTWGGEIIVEARRPS